MPMMGNVIIPSLTDILAKVKARTGKAGEAGRERLSPALAAAVLTKEKLNISPAYTNEQSSRLWIEKLTDKSNLWLNAMRYEDENDMARASVLYLNDAKESLASGSMARAALSASCAANCIAAMGDDNDARRLYLESGKMYEENAYSAKSSIRETLWSLEKAYVNYMLARENLRAQQARERFISMARKANPFLDGNSALSFQVPTSVNGSYSGSVDEKVYSAMTEFLELRLSKQAPKNP